MSIEYIAPVELTTVEATQLRSWLSEANEYALLPSAGDKLLKLRFASPLPRETWPDDIEIWIENPLRVVVHSSTRQQRTDLLELLQRLLGKLGHNVPFHED